MIGSTIQQKLFAQILKFRIHKYIITADIEKMDLQILVHPEDRKYLRVLWYHDNKIRTYQFNTVTFGQASSLYLAIRTVQQLA